MKEALRLALEALKTIDDAMPFPVAKLAIKECTAALEAKDEPMHPDIKKLYKDYFDKCFRESSPSQRTWVGLTDEEISDLWCEVSNTDFVTADTHVFARAIEAKLKEKNA
jgi:hypothetical protein